MPPSKAVVRWPRTSWDVPPVRRLGPHALVSNWSGRSWTQATTFAIKVAVRRPRPDGGRFSLPSGHASTAFATATILDGHFGWRVSVPTYVLATYVATSRLHENRHNASDVVFGAAVGIAAGRVTLRREKSRVVIQPVAMGGGAGVIVLW